MKNSKVNSILFNVGNIFRKSKDSNIYSEKKKKSSKATSEQSTEAYPDVFNDPFSRKQSELDIDLSDIKDSVLPE